jgi:hypothetical protein
MTKGLKGVCENLDSSEVSAADIAAVSKRVKLGKRVFCKERKLSMFCSEVTELTDFTGSSRGLKLKLLEFEERLLKR